MTIFSSDLASASLQLNILGWVVAINVVCMDATSNNGLARTKGNTMQRCKCSQHQEGSVRNPLIRRILHTDVNARELVLGAVPFAMTVLGDAVDDSVGLDI